MLLTCASGPDSFKAGLPADRAATAIAGDIARVLPSAEYVLRQVEAAFATDHGLGLLDHPAPLTVLQGGSVH